MSFSREVDAVVDSLLEDGIDYLGVGDIAVDEGIAGIALVFLDVVEIEAQAGIALCGGFADDGAPGAVVKLQETASCRVELADEVLVYGGDVPDQVVEVGVDGDGAGVVVGHDELLEELRGRGDRELGNGLAVLKLLDAAEIVDERVRLRREFTGQEHPVKAGRHAVERDVAAFLVRHAAEAPEEVQVPEGAVELAVGDDVIAQLLLLVCQFAHELVARAVGKVLGAEETAYEVGPLRDLDAFDRLAHGDWSFISASKVGKRHDILNAVL